MIIYLCEPEKLLNDVANLIFGYKDFTIGNINFSSSDILYYIYNMLLQYFLF